MSNFKNYNKIRVLNRLYTELQLSEDGINELHPEAAADVHWAVIALERALSLLRSKE